MKIRELSSFRDPSGYIYYDKDKVIRKINPCYFKEYNHLMNSGLYDELEKNNLLISHKEIKNTKDEILLDVKKIPYVSYPYEWTFEQLKDAALLTLKINKIAMKYGMILKDCSCYNVMFLGSCPIFIDTLSFMFYNEGDPWGSYGQFSRHFIAPLVLMKYVDIRLNSLLKNYIDGIPLDLCSNMLGKKGGFISYLHIKLQNKSIIKHNYDGHKEVKDINISKRSILNMLSMLSNQITKLSLNKIDSEWNDYYNNSNYSDESDKMKKKIIIDFCKKASIDENDIVFDLGANDGKFSNLIFEKFNSYIVNFDIDYNCIERNYISNKTNSKILSLLMDINNPSSSIGFSNKERKSFLERGNCSLMLVLAFIHHMVISNNLSFNMIANFFYDITNYLIIEFVPKDDTQVEVLLRTRKDMFDFYEIGNFKKEFSSYFNILDEVKIDGSKRTLFLMKRK